MQRTAQQAVKLLSNRPNIFADISVDIDGEIVSVQKKKPASDITVEFLEELADEPGTDSITLRTFRKNGSSYLSENTIDIVSENSQSTSRSTNQINGFDDDEGDSTSYPKFSPPTPTMIPSNADSSLLQYIANEKSKRADELERRNQKLEMDNERMKSKILSLENDLKLKDREHELVLQSQEVDSKNSLSGLFEQAARPEILGALPSLIAALKGGPSQNALPAGNDVFSDIEDEGQRAAIIEMVNYLKTSQEVTSKLYVITLKCAKHPGLADKILKFLEKYN